MADGSKAVLEWIFEYRPIGIIRSPFKRLEDMPIQPSGAKGVRGTVEVFEPFVDGMQDLLGFSHLILLYHFHKVRQCRLKVKPFLDTEERGVFATRAPVRPNPVGLSVVKLLDICGPVIYIENVDILNETPLIDIKPFVPAFDVPEPPVRVGWLERKTGMISGIRSDDRFVDESDAGN
ncbi:tRNA (N6-threonylcarbamoyladenosine(37)-N6)-methyltransferase TrmO [Thermodesulforhabdus norvegica]|uniref:tRNA-Thr(GGU) m(6)t(6)A37 methyltransferase TsaA n=1 Tax=Thermodesulforhabdus norvegica TaxID=39841 RepID=A0A1I4SIH4_9BACT|nr:tRNA (N6-threonylcarbamoyladenosine(37)-N6)-methyltransferase TrmO [Thermodesulforhabdus norvegica]SFM64249.1 tRNA-Thr(GGU) m(6)t(6)A37 methyltransferase TsaA [Thermodesulforhabdus norvegica]